MPTIHHAAPDSQDLRFFRLDAPSEEHERAIASVLLLHLGSVRGERAVFDAAGRLAGVVTTPTVYQAMMRFVEQRVREAQARERQ